MSYEFAPDSLATCPFDPNHKVAAHKLQTHIIKCRRSHPELERQFVACPFNASHLIPTSEKEKHIMICIDKDRLVNKRSHHVQSCDLSVPIYENYVHNPDYEDWDRDTDIDVLQPALGSRPSFEKLESNEDKSIFDDKSQSDVTSSQSQSSLSTLSEHKISRGRGQMLKIYGKFYK
ncbi:gametocyte-specific factor 1-like isoform X2 [Brachionus plicatilis]|uniref:Gametocyte-specific factor 1-like isoform X2 n=1 Tax=Brachionus plicatilis TaxID=10195 RepID=A0A3M7SQQ4_BRAPC|nr:gametocyte-specific factor 1-like isoform X2 [Brachionus plicatilis]